MGQVNKLPCSFYQDTDVVMLARALIGKVLVTSIDGMTAAGMIIETEAYAGAGDRASHAFGNRFTERTAPMFAKGGIAYVYLIYGIHSLFNVVTGPDGIPHAVLVRALKPLDNIDLMMQRRKTMDVKRLCNGPGTLSQAMGIHFSDSGTSLLDNRIWIEDRGFETGHEKIITGPRINVGYAGKDALLPYRFRIND